MLAAIARVPLRRRALAISCVAFGLLAGLTACMRAPRSNPPQPATLTAADATGTYVRGQTVVFTVTLANPSSDDLADMQLVITNQTSPFTGLQPLNVQGVACVPQHATCPAIAGNGTATPFMLPASGVLTLTVTTQVVLDFAGQSLMRFEAFSAHRSGLLSVDAHVALADARDGYYELFTTSGLRDNLDVDFDAGATKFATAPVHAEDSFVSHGSGHVFPSGAIFNSATDLLVGQADFGNGPETFIGARRMVDAIADLDGLAFTTLGVSSPAGGAATGTVRTMAIAGSTMDVCSDATHALATCPTASLRHYALSLPSTGGVIFTATDSADNDSFDFQVAHNGDALILLQADRSAGGDGTFAIGFANASAPADGLWTWGMFGGAHDALAFKAGTSFTAWSIDIEGNALSQGPQVALLPVAGGPAGLMTAARPSDGAALLMLQQGGLLVVGGPAGQLDLMIDPALTH